MAEPVETPIGTVTAEHFRPGHIRHQVVCGPKFLHALFNPNDRMHAVSRAFVTFVRDGDLPYRRHVVNDHIVDEAATRLKKQASVQHATTFLMTLDESDLYRLSRPSASGLDPEAVHQFESVAPEVFHDATDTFVKWTDLDASLTDFVVASHMTELDIDHILTYDRHYDAFDVTTLPYRDHD